MDLKGKIYCGIVEETNDPDRNGRIKIRVQGLFEEIPLEHIPWAKPYRSIAGKSFEIPAVGKLVNVVFTENDFYNPSYIYSQNYNINLQNILKEYSDEEYERFIALLFDHRTQIYSDDTELTFDYKYNKITISNEDINFELKDNNQKVNIGTKNSSQQAMLGNNWLKWFDEFVRAWQNDAGMNGNLFFPVLKPKISYDVLVKYWSKRETFISDHVNIVDNFKVKKLQ